MWMSRYEQISRCSEVGRDRSCGVGSARTRTPTAREKGSIFQRKGICRCVCVSLKLRRTSLRGGKAENLKCLEQCRTVRGCVAAPPFLQSIDFCSLELFAEVASDEAAAQRAVWAAAQQWCGRNATVPCAAVAEGPLQPSEIRKSILAFRSSARPVTMIPRVVCLSRRRAALPLLRPASRGG